MSSSTLPNYEEAIKPILKLQKDGLSNETTAKVYTAMAEKTTGSKDDIIAEVKKLAQRAVATDKSFEDIRRQLVKVDQNEYKDKTGQPIAKLAPTWTKYQKVGFSM
jgi:hypothetical protein